MKILVTGFEAFHGEEINPSEEIVKALAESAGEKLHTLVLPVEFKEAEKKLEEAVIRIQPEAIISLGQAAGREGITLERVAINVDDAKFPDNIGYQPIDTPIREGGQAAYFTTLPVKKMLDYLRANQIEARISNTAGTYVCNHVMYHALFLAETRYPSMKAGFVHVPYIKAQVMEKENTPSMELSDMIRAVEFLIRYLEENDSAHSF